MDVEGKDACRPSTKQSSNVSDSKTPPPPELPSMMGICTGSLVEQDKFSFIQSLTGNRKHRGKYFYRHLFNVYSYLKQQNARDEICDAGLFHSIYGTEFFSFQNNRVTRDIVRGFIGDYAEDLVHIFCTAKDRYHVIVDNTLGLTTQQVIDLAQIEAANVVDQNKDGQYDKQLKILNEIIAWASMPPPTKGTENDYPIANLHD